MRNKLDVLDRGFVELVQSMGDDKTVVESARVSYLGTSRGDDRDKTLLFYLMEHGHTSPFEQVEFRFRVKCPMFVARQWMRHRTWSYNEISRRYTSEEIEFYIPTAFRKQSDSNKQVSTDEEIKCIDTGTYMLTPEEYLKSLANYLHTQYRMLLLQGVSREQARMVLPQNLYTSFYAKVDLKNLLDFLRLRLSKDAQWEIRQYALAILELIEDIVPWSVEAYKKYRMSENKS